MKKQTVTNPTVVNSANKVWYQYVSVLEKKEEISKTKILEVISNAVQKIINKNIDPEALIEFVADEVKEEVEIYNKNVEVVEDDFDFDIENHPESTILYVKLSDAKKLYPNAKFAIETDNDEDLYSIPMVIDLTILDNSKEPKVKRTLQTIKSTITQDWSTLKKAMIFEKYSPKIGEEVLVECTSRNSNQSWNVKLIDDEVTAYLPANNISTKKNLGPGKIIKVVIESVTTDSKLSQIQVSLDTPKTITNLIKNEVPEVSSGLIEIVDCVRKPGERTKVVVRKAAGVEADLDPAGAIIGQNGSRISAISAEVENEPIDVILYSEDIKEYIKNAMSPAQVVDVVEKGKNAKSYYVIVPDTKVTNAIGKKAINVTLASKLTGAILDIIKVSSAKTEGIKFNENFVEKPSVEFVKPSKPAAKPKKSSDNLFMNMSEFDNDVKEFEEALLENGFGASDDLEVLDFEELLRKHTQKQAEEAQNAMSEFENSMDHLDEITNEVNEETSKEAKSNKKLEISSEDFQKAKELAKTFKYDDELNNFGLLEDIDFSEFEDDWDEN